MPYKLAKNSTSWWRGHNHVTQTGETGEVKKLKLLLLHPHLCAGFVLNEGSLFLKLYKWVFQVNLHVNLGPQQSAPRWSCLSALGLSVLGALARRLWAGGAPSGRV